MDGNHVGSYVFPRKVETGTCSYSYRLAGEELAEENQAGLAFGAWCNWLTIPLPRLPNSIVAQHTSTPVQQNDHSHIINEP